MSTPSVPIVVLAYHGTKTRSNSPGYTGQNGPQVNSLYSGCYIFVSGGMNLALSLGWNLYTHIPNSTHFMLSWFIGVIVGVLASLPLHKHVPKKCFMIIGGFLVLASGIIFTSVPYNFDALLAGRYVNGFGVGFVTVPFLIHASEIAMNRNRGACLSFEQFAVTFGIAIQVIYSSQWAWGMSFAANRVHGIIDIVLAVLCLVSVAMIIESPIFHLRKYNDDAALESIRRLQSPPVITDDRRVLFEELKSYVQHNDNHRLGEDLRDSVAPLIRMMLYRGMVAFSFSLPFSTALELSSFVALGQTNDWPPIVFGVLRLLGAIVGISLLDTLGRKIPPAICLLLMAGLATGIAVIFSTQSNLLDSHEMSISCALSLLQQFFAGAFTPSTSVYLGEAFPLNLKAYCIGLCVIFEQIIHVIVICTFANAVFREVYVYGLYVAVIMYVSFILFCVTLPETKNHPLHETTRRFKSWIHLKCS